MRQLPLSPIPPPKNVKEMQGGSLKQHKNRGYREKGRSNAAAGPAAKTVLETESA